MAALPHISRLTAACESFLFVRTACINASGNAAGISRRTASVDFPVFASMNIIDSAHQDTAESVQGVSLRKVGDSVGHKICLDPLEKRQVSCLCWESNDDFSVIQSVALSQYADVQGKGRQSFHIDTFGISRCF